jgi:hypothetical protein
MPPRGPEPGTTCLNRAKARSRRRSADNQSVVETLDRGKCGDLTIENRLPVHHQRTLVATAETAGPAAGEDRSASQHGSILP